jgi:hypothetical protein
MKLRYLFGPVHGDFADQNLRLPRQRGYCLAFGPEPVAADLHVQAGDPWEAICGRLPVGWRPDFVALYLPYTIVPDCLWSAPVPLVGLALDWHLLFHHYRRRLPHVDAVLTDAPGVETLARAGIPHALPANATPTCTTPWAWPSPCDAATHRPGRSRPRPPATSAAPWTATRATPSPA